MSDGALSQDEIDALMGGSDNLSFAGTGHGGGQTGLTDADKKAFAAMMADITPSQSAALTGMMGKTVSIGSPAVSSVEGLSLPESVGEDYIRIKCSYTEGFTGYHCYIFPNTLASSVASALSGLEQMELDEAAISALTEAVNIIKSSAASALGESKNVNISTETPAADMFNAGFGDFPSETLVKLDFTISIEGESEKVFSEIFSSNLVKEIVSPKPASENVQNAGSASSAGAASAGTGGGGNFTFRQPSMMGVQNVQLSNLTQSSVPEESGNIGLIMDVNMEMTVELGRTKKPIREILSMGEGTIIELDKLAGEPVDILVNHKLIANGEVVVIDENFGVRVTKIVSSESNGIDLH